MRNALVPIGILVALVTGGTPAHAQNNHGDWTIYAATGDMSDIELTGTTAWIGAKGGIVSLDLATAAQNEPVQRKIGVAEGLIDADVTSLALDSFGNVWVGTKENGISVFNSEGEHIRELNSFEHLWSDLVVDMRPIGNKMYVACTDQYTAIGGLDGGGYVPIKSRNRTGTFSSPGSPSGLESISRRSSCRRRERFGSAHREADFGRWMRPWRLRARRWCSISQAGSSPRT
jgi:DNA-binding beta-propeller fold protein YncE